jgi:arabinofuranosyltransferase
VFRAGYYGTLVPLPALAKSASSAAWRRGVIYLYLFARPFLPVVPVVALVAIAALGRRARPTAISAVPLVVAVLLTAFIARVGGDFMFGRLMIVPSLLAVMPVLVVPAARRTALGVVALAAWAAFFAAKYAPGTRRLTGDERMAYQLYTGARNPIVAEDHVKPRGYVAAQAERALRDGRRVIVFEAGDEFALHPARPGQLAVAAGRLGLAGAVAPLDAIVIDTFGLANPLGARITLTQPGSTGHEKLLPMAWVIADFADPAVTGGVPAAELAAARHALGCGELAELLESVRAPLTARRFWANLWGAARRTRLVIPADPIAAEAALCARAPR